MLDKSESILWNNKTYKLGSFKEFSKTKDNIGCDDFNKIAYMIRSYLGPFEYSSNMAQTGRFNAFDDNLAYLLGVMQWHNDNYIFDRDLSNKANADKFIQFIKYYMLTILNDYDAVMFDRMMQMISNGLYSTISDSAYDAVNDYYNNPKNFVVGLF